MSDGSWKPDAPNGNWADPQNWSGSTVPTGNAVFSTSTETALAFAPGAAQTIGEITFDADSQPFSINITHLDKTPALTIDGAGVTNASLAMQSFVVASYGTYHQPQLSFTGKACAGDDTVLYYAGPTSLTDSFGGGTIGFYEGASAGSARFTVRTGQVSPHQDTSTRPPKQVPPGQKDASKSTLGGSIVFNNDSAADHAVFSLFGTLGSDGDTFGNVVFHDKTSAHCATFLNYGGTVPGGDGGNTQFYDASSAATGVYVNYGGTAYKDAQWGGANGGDVAFDGVATGGSGWFQNYPASVEGAHGGVTSFNNNPNFPAIDTPGASAANGTYVNYGANDRFPGGGGHTELTARYGFSKAGQGTFVNFGSTQKSAASAGHTIFAIDPPNAYNPTAENGVFWNHPGISAGYTEFLSYSDAPSDKQPDAGQGVFHNLGSASPDEAGGYTVFKNRSQAGQATLIAHGGVADGNGGRIIFADSATGGTAHVSLMGNGTLDLSGHTGGLTIGTLSLLQGVICVSVGPQKPALTTSHAINLHAGPITLMLSKDADVTLKAGTQYPLIDAPNMAELDLAVLSAATDFAATAHLAVDGTRLYATFTDIGS